MAAFPTEGRATPLISVLIRSINRPQLADALRSVIAQTYRPLEVVVAGACTEPFALPDIGISDVSMRFVSRGEALGLSAAANLALDEAHGEFLIFLDDDDYFLPTHIKGLFAALSADTEAVLAYSGIRLENSAGKFIGFLKQPSRYSRLSLHEGNFIQISAALFSKRLISHAGCRFDEALPLFVDWDFWLQIAALGRFTHALQYTTCWRTEGGTSGAGMGSNRDDEKRTFAAHHIRSKHAPQRTEIEAQMQQLAQQLDAAWERSDFEQARGFCEQSIALNSKQPAIFNRWGLIALRAEQWQIADKLFCEGLQLAPDDPALLANLAQLYAATERLQHARVYAHLAALLQPTAAPLRALANRLGVQNLGS